MEPVDSGIHQKTEGEEMKPTDEAKRLSYEIADEYLPDVNILGVDGPNTGLADEIIKKVLDAAVEAARKRLRGTDSVMSWEFDAAINEAITEINKLRP